MCKYCEKDDLIKQKTIKGSVWFGGKGKIACIDSINELVVNVNGVCANIPIKFCPWCGASLSNEKTPIEKLKVIVKDGCKEDFETYCRVNSICYSAYPSLKSLENRYCTECSNQQLKGAANLIVSIEKMPICVLD